MKVSRIFNRLSLLMHALLSISLYFVIEALSRHSVGLAWSFMMERPLVFLYNASYIFVTLLPVYLSRRRVFWRTVICIFWIILGLINCLLLANRVTPFTGPDLKLITDGLSIMTKYLPAWGATLGFIALGCLGVFLLIFFFLAPKYKGKRLFRIAVPLVAAGILLEAGFTQLLLDKRILSNYFGNIAFAYEDYGYPYCLLTTVFQTGIGQPRDYSEAEIRRIERSENILPKTEIGKKPNIIFVQLESFFDPRLVNYLDISQDPIPFFRKLMKEYSSGYFKVPVVGAGTVNTEFECITGMSLHYFGPGEYPYKGILLKTPCESTAYILKNLGYSTHAIHNNEANFYGRKKVFAHLGFDTFTSEEYMPHEDRKNPLGWVEDRVLTEEILKCLDSTKERDYVYTISVQGHGDYPEEEVIEDPLITVSGSDTPEKDYQWEYYVNQLYEMDLFVEELVQALSEREEPSILVLYGDHLPTMGLTVEDLENRYLFQTQYVIWDNLGLDKEDENLSSYQISAEILGRLGIHEGNILRYHQARRNTRNYQVDLEMLQYDILYGKMYSYENQINPYKKTQMRLGLYDVTLDSIRQISETDHTYYIFGSNFTPSAQMKINGDWYDTVYISPTRLLITGRQLDDFDRLAVVIRSNSSTRKALSKSYDRAVFALYDGSKWKVRFPEDDL
ncbi:MAG: sulfatase-like hydrolase/transferase [Blautia sp.]|nr:sulfatase-like hydrolase/transferase [Blautia sp.]